MDIADWPSTPWHPPDLGRLQARLADPASWLLPAWAALCGAVAAGIAGRPGSDWLRVGLLIVLVDVGWGVLWAALGMVEWAAAFRLWRAWSGGAPLRPLPYTLPGAPGDRLARGLGELRAWWSAAVWPVYAPVIVALAVALATTGVVSVWLGSPALLLSVGALAMMELGVAWDGGRGGAPAAWDASITLLLPWLAGHAVIAPTGAPTLRSAGLAALFALACGAAGRAETRWGRVLGIGAQVAAAAALIALRHPLAASGLWLLLIPQMALLVWVRRGQPAAWYARSVWPWLAAAMFAAAWAVRGV